MAAQVTFEDILAVIGSGGRWQLVVFLWTAIGGMLAAMHNLSSVFLAGVPDHRCAIPGEVTNTSDLLVEQWIPRDNLTGKWSQCRRFSGPSTGVEQPCDGWVYSHDQYTSTLVERWDLVCDRTYLRSTLQSTYMLGIFVGAIVSGTTGDLWGRKRSVCIFAVTFIVSSLAAAFVDSYLAFAVLRFVTAASGAGTFGGMFVLCVEIVESRWRALVGLMYQIPFAIGFMLLPGIAYLVRDWRQLQLYISAPSVVMLLYWWVLPESLRWLIMHDKLEEALDVCKFAARRNQRKLPEDQHLLKMMKDFKETELNQMHEAETRQKSRIQTCCDGFLIFIKLLKTPKLRRISLSSFYNWLVIAMLYYGISFDSAKLSRDAYLAIFLSGLVELPAYLISVPIINRIGRRLSLIIFHITTTVFMLIIMGVPNKINWLKMVCGMLGKLAASANFGIIYIYTAELYPTTLRSVGLGASSTCARVGSMAAPYIVDLLNPVHWAIPSVVFAVSAFTAGAAALLLPETNAKPLAETEDHVEHGKCNTQTASSSLELRQTPDQS